MTCCWVRIVCCTSYLRLVRHHHLQPACMLCAATLLTKRHAEAIEQVLLLHMYCCRVLPAPVTLCL
jgi:hypothetical protein